MQMDGNDGNVRHQPWAVSRFLNLEEAISMSLIHRPAALYHPYQPTFDKLLNTYTQYKTAVLDIFNNGVQFEGFYIDSKHIDRTFVLPDGCVNLVICCHPQYPSANICGNLFKGRQGIFVRAECEYFVVRFLPGYAEHFFKHPIGEFSELEVPIQEVLPHADELLEQVAEQTSLEGRVRAFEHFFLKYIGDELEIPLLVKYLTEKIIAGSGTSNVKQLSEDTGYSSRYLSKNFEKYVGLSPKLFSRIIRFQNVIHLLEKQQYEQALPQIFELGYFDQNHFIKEFKEFSMLTPKKFIQQLAAGSLSVNTSQRVTDRASL